MLYVYKYSNYTFLLDLNGLNLEILSTVQVLLLLLVMMDYYQCLQQYRNSIFLWKDH